MDDQRWQFLSDATGPCVFLRPEEMEAGWHWCHDWDGLLVGPGMHEAIFCNCNIAKIEEWKESDEGRKIDDSMRSHAGGDIMDGGTF